MFVSAAMLANINVKTLFGMMLNFHHCGIFVLEYVSKF